MSKQNTKLHVNPRSTGIVSANTYEKHTQKINLMPEALELTRCRDLSIRTKHVNVVELVDFNETTNRLTTRRVDAQELFLKVWNSTYFLGRLKGHHLSEPDTLRARIIELGSWLKKYHLSSIEESTEGASGRSLEADFHKKIKDIRRNRLIPETKLARIEKKFGKDFSNLSQPSYLNLNGAFPCRVHGDFTIYNILIDHQNDLHILDFGDTRISGNFEDLARFYSGLWAISRTNRSRFKLLSDLPERFLNAYGVSHEITETPYFRCNLAFNFLTHLAAQNYMKELLSWNSNREMSLITKAGLEWIYEQI
ncbi:phosphotransferase [uncultured Marinobacter sp.]|uniref:phosphotransferase n=1 Tax=uncultured Marinobacter sp. TaxID=187379 RepID=UPI00260B5D0C|nr:phosphotransferase [uncultured Marinobacter sp.]